MPSEPFKRGDRVRILETAMTRHRGREGVVECDPFRTTTVQVRVPVSPGMHGLAYVTDTDLELLERSRSGHDAVTKRSRSGHDAVTDLDQ